MIHLNLFNATVTHKDNVIHINLSEPMLSLVRMKIVTEDQLVTCLKDSLSGDLSQINIYRLVVKSNYVFTDYNKAKIRSELAEYIMEVTECYYNMSFADDIDDDYQYDYFEIMLKEDLMSIDELNYLSDFYDTKKAINMIYEYSVIVEEWKEDTLDIDSINRVLYGVSQEYIDEYLDSLYADYIREEDHNRMIMD